MQMAAMEESEANPSIERADLEKKKRKINEAYRKGR